MGNVVARLKKTGKEFEILVDLERALLFRKTGQGSVENILAIDEIFSDHKKGLKASSSDMTKAFSTSDRISVAAEIIKHGEIQLPAEFKKKERDEKIKKVIFLISRICVDPRTGMPHTADRIKTAIDEAGVSLSEKSAEEQVGDVIEKIRVILPLKSETKKVIVKVPAIYVGKAYGLLHEFGGKEEWMQDGSISVVVNLPAALQLEFYDKLNAITHGNSLTEEIKEVKV